MITVRRRLVAFLVTLSALAAAIPAGAATVTYTYTALGVNGNVGNTGTSGSLSNTVTADQSFSVTSRTLPGSNSDQNPPGTYVGGTNFGNWDTSTIGVYAMVGTTAGGLYFTNGSNEYFNGSFNVAVVPEPATLALAGIAAFGFIAARARRQSWRRRLLSAGRTTATLS